MFKLAHISDIHLSPLPEPDWSQLASKRILGYLNWKRNRKHSLTGNYLEKLLADLPGKNPDHIMVSGDLVNLALPEEFENALAFLQSLGTPENVSAVCGNHDAYVPGGLQKAIDTWQPYMSGDDVPIESDEDYPYLRIRGNVAIIGCNSAEATGPFMATGYFRENQAKRLAQILEKSRNLFRVVCIHHSPIPGATKWYKRLIGDDLFRDVIAQHGAELVLHGHTHLATTHFIDGTNGGIPVVCVPAAGNGEGGKRPAGRYNLFTIESSDNGWSVQHEAYGWVEAGHGVEILEKADFNLKR
ncbi:MAG: metallophosphoesterase [Pseudomonadota bacterium]